MGPGADVSHREEVKMGTGVVGHKVSLRVSLLKDHMQAGGSVTAGPEGRAQQPWWTGCGG